MVGLNWPQPERSRAYSSLTNHFTSYLQSELHYCTMWYACSGRFKEAKVASYCYGESTHSQSIMAAESLATQWNKYQQSWWNLGDQRP